MMSIIFFFFYKMLMCVHGSIGVGKTTFINTLPYNRMVEPLDDWLFLF